MMPPRPRVTIGGANRYNIVSCPRQFTSNSAMRRSIGSRKNGPMNDAAALYTNIPDVAIGHMRFQRFREIRPRNVHRDGVNVDPLRVANLRGQGF
jgi:hypothetical protein